MICSPACSSADHWPGSFVWRRRRRRPNLLARSGWGRALRAKLTIVVVVVAVNGVVVGIQCTSTGPTRTLNIATGLESNRASGQFIGPVPSVVLLHSDDINMADDDHVAQVPGWLGGWLAGRQAGRQPARPN